jgi:hypothetical protein
MNMGDDGMDRAALEFGARLRAQVPDPDEVMAARLRAARRAAVAAMPETGGAWSVIPFAAAAVLMLTVSLGLWTTTTTTTQTASGIDDPGTGRSVEILGPPLDEDDLALLDDLEFYAWLELQAQTEGSESEPVDAGVTDG